MTNSHNVLGEKGKLVVCELNVVFCLCKYTGWIVGWLISFTLTPRKEAICRLPQLYISEYVHVEYSTT
jgi:hypothetical protein